MNRFYLVFYVAYTLFAASEVGARSTYASVEEASIATNLAQKIGLLSYCNMDGEVSDISKKLHTFAQSHKRRSMTPLSTGMAQAVARNNHFFVRKAGGKKSLCAGMIKIKRKAVGSVQLGWSKLQKVHGRAHSKVN